ncbi:LLM class flavin-dependent oxidoreductase [Streptomyces sp. NPDC085927]|uniref:LLM class flavin-dependent oxidoreductase n=1 Tax=Streptomyces sp. NPDC085927 TaxID=3365738 RepID=UPI0037D313C0
MKYSVMLPFMGVLPQQAIPYAALVDRTSLMRLWQGQAMSIEPHQLFAYAAGQGFNIPVGTCVSVMPFRHPFEAAIEARSLALTTGKPVVAGFGPGARLLQETLLGRPYASPLAAVREYLTLVRSLLDGEMASEAGTYFTAKDAMLPPLPGPAIGSLDIELGLGVLRPGMARLVGELADVAITWLTPPKYLQDRILPAMREAAATAGRAVPRIAAVVPVSLTKNGRDAASVVLAGSRFHLQAPHYLDMLTKAGLKVDSDQPEVTARSLVAADGFISGTPEDVVKGLDAYRAAGVDEVVLNLTGVCALEGEKAAFSELAAIQCAIEDSLGQESLHDR